MAEFQGNGTTISFSPANIFSEVFGMAFEGRSRGFVDFSTFATTGSMVKEPHALSDAGQLTVEFLADPSADPDTAINSAKGSAVITFPTGAIWTVDALITSGPTLTLPFHDRATSQVVFELSGGVVVT